MKTDDAAIELGIALGYPQGGTSLTRHQVEVLCGFEGTDFDRGRARFCDVFQLKDGGSPLVTKYDPVDKLYRYRIAQSKDEAPAYIAKRAKSLKTQTIRLKKTNDASTMKFGEDPATRILGRILDRQQQGLEDLMEIAELDGGTPQSA